MDIANNIQKFIDGEGKNQGRKPDERYASFDYCFNYFQSFREQDKIDQISSNDYIQSSCLQLAYYLASWGMLRGSSFLLEKSLKYYVDLINNISRFDKGIWDIDVDSYADANITLVLKCKTMVIESLGNKYRPSDTLASKIMLGVFANTPAFDAYFCKGFNIYKFDKEALDKISQFYKDNKMIIDGYSIYTLDFHSGQETNRKYTKAKLIDMIGFIEGQTKGPPDIQ